MKIKLQTLLKHNWRTLLLLCTLIIANQGVWGATVRGSFNNWTDVTLVNGSCSITINNAGNYEFGVDDSGFHKSGSISRASNSATLSTNGSNTSISVDCAGTYIFTWNSSNKKITVTYPTMRYAVAGNGSGNWCGGNDWSTTGSEMTVGNSTCYPDIPSICFENVSQSNDLEFKIVGYGGWVWEKNWSNSNANMVTVFADEDNESVSDASNNIKLVTSSSRNITIAYDPSTDKVYVKTVTCLSNFTSVTIDPNSKSVCVGSTFTIGTSSSDVTIASDPSTSVTWSFVSSTPSVATVTPAGVVTGVTAGTATITATVSKEGYNDASVTCSVTVNATSATGSLKVGGESPVSGTADVCKGASTVTLSTTDNVGSTYKWEHYDTSDSEWKSVGTESTYGASNTVVGSEQYRLSVKNGACAYSTPTTVTVRVNPVPSGTTISGDSPVCAGTTGLTYSASSTAVAGSTYSYAWEVTGTDWIITSGETSSSATMTAGTANGTVKVTPTLTTTTSGKACAGSQVTKSVTVNALPTITLTGVGGKSASATYPWDYMTITATTTPADLEVDWDKVYSGSGSQPANSVTKSESPSHTYKIKSAITSNPYSDKYTIKANGTSSGCNAIEAVYDVYINNPDGEICD